MTELTHERTAPLKVTLEYGDRGNFVTHQNGVPLVTAVRATSDAVERGSSDPVASARFGDYRNGGEPFTHPTTPQQATRTLFVPEVIHARLR